jgi:CubicO group peptidase (beta-lactamase class C family)
MASYPDAHAVIVPARTGQEAREACNHPVRDPHPSPRRHPRPRRQEQDTRDLMTSIRCGRRHALGALAALAACAPAPPPPSDMARDASGPVFSPVGPDLARYATSAGGYATASRANWWQPGYSVDGFSRLDAIWPAARVAGAAVPAPWRRAPAEPQIVYEAPRPLGGGRHDVAGFMARNPTTGLLIARGDTILVERYGYARHDRHRLTSFSMAKTIAAMLLGIAHADGAIASLEDPASRYVPDLAGTGYGDTPLRHLLTMSSGIAFRETYDRNDDVALLARATIGQQGRGGAQAVRPFDTREAPPGARWSYASAETQVLGLVLRAAIGRPIAAYMQERVWQPIGAEADASWLLDRSGQEIVFSFFNAVLRDYARFAMLLARGGAVDGRSVIPAAWIREATHAHVPLARTGRGLGYGFQTWVLPEGDGSFAFLGVRGQAILVDPRRELVLVHTAVRPEARDPGNAETFALWRAARGALGG